MTKEAPKHIIGGRRSWPVAGRPGTRGPLVRVQVGPGRFVRMWEQDAIEQGLLAVEEGGGSVAADGRAQQEEKQQGRPRDKMRRPATNKTAEESGGVVEV